MPITNATVSVDDSPVVVLVDRSGTTPASFPVVLYNAGVNTVYLGGPSVTSSTGIPLAASSTFAYDVPAGDKVYGICASGESCTVRVMKGSH